MKLFSLSQVLAGLPKNKSEWPWSRLGRCADHGSGRVAQRSGEIAMLGLWHQRNDPASFSLQPVWSGSSVPLISAQGV
jgi:hypothetical protein